jgi:rubrerythrin
MKFGKLKSKIENKLVESYKNGTIKSDMSKFNSLVLKNKNVSKLFYLYDELTSNRGLNESIANEYINQSITFYENTINKINPNDLKDLNAWLEGTEYNNEYDVVDELFSTGITKLEEKITSKKTILETITKSPKEEKEVVNIPLKTMVGIANKTIRDYVSNLSESDQKKIKTILSSNEDELKEKYNSLKESVISKLEKIQESEQDKEVGNTINETIEKVSSESFDKLTYLKLQELNNNL